MPRNLIVTKIALQATVLTPLTKYALEFAPFAIKLEHSLSHSMKFRTKMIIRGTVGSILLISILILALSMPYLEYVFSLTGPSQCRNQHYFSLLFLHQDILEPDNKASLDSVYDSDNERHASGNSQNHIFFKIACEKFIESSHIQKIQFYSSVIFYNRVIFFIISIKGFHIKLI